MYRYLQKNKVENEIMYGLPAEFDTNRLCHRTLEMVCFNLNQVYFHFSGGLTIVIEGQFGQKLSNESDEQLMEPPVQKSELMQLLEHSIVDASIESAGTLKLSFDHGHVLKCYDSNPNFESYRIELDGEVIYV